MHIIWFFTTTLTSIYILVIQFQDIQTALQTIFQGIRWLLFSLLHPQVDLSLTPTPGTHQPHCSSRIGLDISRLQTAVYDYYSKRLSSSTLKSFCSRIAMLYQPFCNHGPKPPIPAIESALLLFIAHLTHAVISCTKIKVYLAVLHNLHITTRQYNSCTRQLTPYLYQVLKGIKPGSWLLQIFLKIFI